jgi:DNA-nicking Smr family endonuclease
MPKKPFLTEFEQLSGLRKVLADQKAAEEERRREAALALAQIEAEKNLFRNLVGEVKPIAAQGRITLEQPKPAPLPLQRWSDEEQVMKASLSDEMDVERLLDTDDQLSYRRDGIPPETVRKLRRGKWVIQSQLDLHGLRVDEAREAVADYIRTCVRQDIRCVRIIHGKGLGSAGRESVLRDKARRWLVQKEEVLAFCQATPKDGGAGALLVLLRSQ